MKIALYNKIFASRIMIKTNYHIIYSYSTYISYSKSTNSSFVSSYPPIISHTSLSSLSQFYITHNNLSSPLFPSPSLPLPLHQEKHEIDDARIILITCHFPIFSTHDYSLSPRQLSQKTISPATSPSPPIILKISLFPLIHLQ